MINSPPDNSVSLRATPVEQVLQAVRGRALLIGTMGVAITAILVTQAEMVLSTLKIGYLQFPPVSLGLLLIVLAFNRIAQVVSKRFALSSADLMVIYCMMLVGAMVSAHGVIEKLIPLMVAPKYLSTATNGWHAFFDPYTSRALVAYNPANAHIQSVVDNYYSGLQRGQSVPWQEWVLPLFNWGVLVCLILFAFLCMTTIIRRQWVDNEKLSFPLTQLPIELAASGERGLLSNPVTWLGALLPILIFGMNGLHQVQPSVPLIPVQINLSTYISAPPWNAVASSVFFVISFAAIGFFFLLPTDVLFSIWFFFLLTKLEMAVFVANDLPMPGMPIYPCPMFVGYQTAGAYIVLAGYFFYIARPHLAKVWASAIGRATESDSNELLPYRVAFWGLFSSILLSAFWLYRLGLSPLLALMEIVVFLFVTALVLARSTAEGGMLMTETSFRPIDLYRIAAPLHSLGAQNLTVLAFFDNAFLRDQRGLLLTGMLDSSRIADGPKLSRRALTGALVLAVLTALVVAGGLNIVIPYHMGALKMDGWMEQGSPTSTFGDYSTYVRSEPPATAEWQMPTFFCVGLIVTVLLSILRTAFVWWPLHPLGYALCGSWSTIEFWFPCMIAWALKSVTLRYGGMMLYQRVRPFFLGLVIGEFGIAVFFALVNVIWKYPPPVFPWG